MMLMEHQSTLRAVIGQESILAVYQPIVSLVQRRIIGYEGLSRGRHPETGACIPPLALFEEANRLVQKKGHAPDGRTKHRPDAHDSLAESFPRFETDNPVTALDRLCRERCLAGFVPLLERDPSCHLFLNIDASVIDTASGSDYLLRQAQRFGIPHGNIIIEINEGRVDDIAPMARFVNRYRREGFLIALDGVGTGFSNLDRVALLEPDIIKLDRSLVSGIDQNPHKQAVFGCMVQMADKLGAISVAEGVETDAERNAAIACGVHLIQGYCFARPEPADRLDCAAILGRMREAAHAHRDDMARKMSAAQAHRLLLDLHVSMLGDLIEHEIAAGYEALLGDFASQHAAAGVECVFLLDENGIQITQTVFGCRPAHGKRHRGFVFQPTSKGADNSLKKYYYELMNAQIGRYVSDPYISQATGSVCVTFSRILTVRSGQRLVLCVDFVQETDGACKGPEA